MFNLMLAYVGPETVLPVTSALAAIGGAFMLFGGWIKNVCFGGIRRLLRRGAEEVEATEKPS